MQGTYSTKRVRQRFVAQLGRRLPQGGRPGYNPNTPDPEPALVYAPHYLLGLRGNREEFFKEQWENQHG